MAFVDALERFYKRHSLAFNIFLNILLTILSILCYALLVILFVQASWLHIDSLVLVQSSRISPTVAISLLSILLSACTATLLTRMVEHSLWLKLTPREMKHRLTMAESRRLAQWSVSAFARLMYLCTGSSWLLRFGGILLLAVASVSPVLLSGVTPHEDSSMSTSQQPRTADIFEGYLDRGNRLYNGGNFYDNPMAISGLVALSNLSAPSSNICSKPQCHARATIAGIKADCMTSTLDNPDRIGFTSSGMKTQEICAADSTNWCSTLVSSSPSTFANFSTAPPFACGALDYGEATNADCPGEWARIHGAWVNSVDAAVDGDYPIYEVYCELQYGNMTVIQLGNSPAEVLRTEFEKSTYPLGGSSTQWHRTYIESNGGAGQEDTATNPYVFTGLNVGTGANTLYRNSFASMLVNYANANGSNAEQVARKIENNFDMATLFAFARRPDTADVEITIESTIQVWKYDPKVLAILAVPLLATLLVAIGRWRVGNHEEIVGYDPVEIARRGPVLRDGLMGQAEEYRQDQDDGQEKLEVWAVKCNGVETSVKSRLVTG